MLTEGITCIFVLNTVNAVQPPEASDYCLKQLVVGCGCTLVLQIFDKVVFADFLTSNAIEVLDVQKGLVQFFHDIVFKATARTNIGVILGLILIFQMGVGCEVLAWNFNLLPDTVDELLPVLRNLSTDGIHELWVVHESSSLLVKYFEDHASFRLRDIDTLLLNDLFELVDAHHHVAVDVCCTQRLLEYQVPTGVPRSQPTFDPEQYQLHFLDKVTGLCRLVQRLHRLFRGLVTGTILM